MRSEEEGTGMISLEAAGFNGRRGMKLKFIFYVFYPLHLMRLYALAEVFFS